WVQRIDLLTPRESTCWGQFIRESLRNFILARESVQEKRRAECGRGARAREWSTDRAHQLEIDLKNLDARDSQNPEALEPATGGAEAAFAAKAALEALATEYGAEAPFEAARSLMIDRDTAALAAKLELISLLPDYRRDPDLAALRWKLETESGRRSLGRSHID